MIALQPYQRRGPPYGTFGQPSPACLDPGSIKKLESTLGGQTNGAWTLRSSRPCPKASRSETASSPTQA